MCRLRSIGWCQRSKWSLCLGTMPFLSACREYQSLSYLKSKTFQHSLRGSVQATVQKLMSRCSLHGGKLAYVAIHSAPICGKQVTKDCEYSLLFISNSKIWTLLNFMRCKSAFIPLDLCLSQNSSKSVVLHPPAA